MARRRRVTTVTPYRWVQRPIWRNQDGKLYRFVDESGQRVAPDLLTRAQQAKIEEVLRRKLSQEDLYRINAARDEFVRERRHQLEAFTYDQVDRYYARFINSIEQLLRLCGSRDRKNYSLACEVWLGLHSLDEMRDFSFRMENPTRATAITLSAIPPNTIAFEMMLRDLKERVTEGRKKFPTRRNWAARLNPFLYLVGSLRTVFENDGATATAAKSSRAKIAKPSPFVSMVLEVMATLPKDVRQHSHSLIAAQKAISEQISKWRRHEKRHGRTDYFEHRKLFVPPRAL